MRHGAGLYHFVIAVWRAKEAESGAMLTDKTAIQIIREHVRAVQKEGRCWVTAESIEQLLDHLDSGRAEKDIAALVDADKEMALAKHRGDLELFKSVIQSGESARKSFLPVEWMGGCRCAGVNRTPQHVSNHRRASE
jgi:hypothetical protein